MAILNEELCRLFTFKDWPITAAVRPCVLARRGFYYSGPDDTVRCYRCLVALRDWRRGDSPLDRHRRARPDCPVVTDRDILNATVHCCRPLCDLAQRRVSSLTPDDIQYSILSINRSQPDELSLRRLRLMSVRQQTFHDWPCEHIVSSASLARAGFFYRGFGDRVRCAFCRRDVIDWQAGDIPTVEHRRVSYCPFVQQNFCLPVHTSPTSPGAAAGQRHRKNEQAKQRRTPEEIRAENEALRSERLCVICQQNDVNRVLSSCGHLLCSACLVRLQHPCCHVCRRPFNNDKVWPVIFA